MTKLKLFMLMSMLSCLFISPCFAAWYYLGNVGPAGGILFYDRGNSHEGDWKFLEVAPASSEFVAEWSEIDFELKGTDRLVGSGKKNTQLIIAKLNELRQKGKAAQRCASLTIGEYSDWYLPSRDELHFLYNFFKERNEIDGFHNADYWSSTQHEEENEPEYGAWYLNFGNGHQGVSNMNKSMRVRAIRTY